MQDENTDKETLRKALELEWNDHIQTRRQTWRTLEIEAILIVGLVGVDFKFDNPLVVVVLGVLVIVSTISGMLITIHHRKGQIQKFRTICKLEETLGLESFIHGEPPQEFQWLDIINPIKMNTPLFIVRMHIAMMLFTLLYVTAKFMV